MEDCFGKLLHRITYWLTNKIAQFRFELRLV